MLKFWFYLSLICIAAALAGQPVRYDIRFENAVHHEAEVTVQWSGVPQVKLEARMSRSSPGRYAIHEFAKNVYRVQATDGKKRPLKITRPNPYQWDVDGHDGTVTLTYTIFGDRADGTYLAIDRSHARINMPATFMWARGMDERPISLTFHLPKGIPWKIATQLERTATPNAFTAPNLQRFLDSPVELSDHEIRTWSVDAGGKPAKMKLVMHTKATAPLFDAFSTMVRAVVSEHQAMWGQLPRFDYGEYVFMLDYLPYVSGDGMEHRNSTMISSVSTLEKDALRLMHVISHEFFHAWNVERIRPRSLEPFNFEHANMSSELWFAEGFTNYYGPLLIKRAELYSDEAYAEALTRGLATVLSSPGRQYFSAIEMSQQAPFADAATSIDVTNKSNVYLSYYAFGGAIALGLDLTIRTQFPGRSLDDFMRRVLERHGLSEKPYEVKDLQAILGEVVGNPEFAARFFARYIEGKEIVDYAPLLARAGFLLRPVRAGKASLGLPAVAAEEKKLTLTAGTLVGTPAYEAGLDRGDVIVSIGGTKISAMKDIDAVVAKHRVGDVLTIECEQRGEVRKLNATLREDPRMEVVRFEKAARQVTPEMAAFRESWLGKKSPEKFPTLVRHCPGCKGTYAFRNAFCPVDGKALNFVP